jgi:hypothetical protein
LAAGLLAAGSLFAAATPAAAPPRKVSNIVENRAGAQFNDKVAVLEELLTSRIAGKGYAVISREVTVNALKTYSSAGAAASSEAAVHVTAGTPSAPGSAAATVAQSGSAKVAVTPDTTRLDQALSDNTSALRLAQNLGADFILIPSLTTYGTERKAYTGDGISTINVTHTLRVSCKIVEAAAGGALMGDAVTASKTIRQSGNLQVDSSEVINELLDDAAGQLADKLVSDTASLPAEIARGKQVEFSIACSMTDIKDQPITVPNVSVAADKRVVKTNAPLEVQPLDVTVELDGVAIGSAPGMFQAFPGLHKLRLSREGFKDWERTVNVYAGQKLRVALQMSDAGFARWQDNMAFLQLLQDDRKLTDAQVKRIEGIAKYWSESHYRVDTKENVKIYKSIY